MNPLQLLRPRPPVMENPGDFHSEPVTDFSRKEPRMAMAGALISVSHNLAKTYQLMIGGKVIPRDRTIDSFNPSHRKQLIGKVARATVQDANDAIAAAKAALPMWRDISAEKRAEILFNAAKILRTRKFELIAWEIYETAKPCREADADLAEAIDFCEFYGREMLRLAKGTDRTSADLPGEENVCFYEPRGVTVIIAPWNFPLAILCGMTTAALVTGNTVIMKPAEQSAVVGAKLMEVLVEAGVPAGVINYLPGDGEEIGPVLVNHPDVATIAFTGSRAVGLSIQKSAAETREGQDHVKRVITEMGGKNAIIVDDDADLDEAVQGIVASSFGYAGQKCSACSRVIAIASVYDSLLSRLVEATRSLRLGYAEDTGNFVPPVIDDAARDRILKAIERGKQEARVAYAGDAGELPVEGCFVAPHIFADVPPESSLAQEEIFGPVLAVMKANDLAEAIAIGNGTKYALTGGVYSRSPANISIVRRAFRVGNLYVNRKITGALVGRQPFGGFKLSGVGSQAGGGDYLQQFMVPRTVTENTMRRGFAAAGNVQPRSSTATP